MQNTQPNGRRRVLKVFTIVQKPGQDKGIWLDIGVASNNRDGSISAKLDAFPVNGQIHIREIDQTTRRNGDNPPNQSWRQNGGNP